MRAARRAWTRRSFLATAGCGLVAMALPHDGSSQSGRGVLMQGAASGRVLVLGAGLAGLAAAWELVEAGHEVIVLEARSRPGGRILTLREPFADALFAEAGGMSFNSSYRHFHRYLGLFGLQAEALDYDPELGSVVYLRGQRIVTPAGGTTTWPYALHDAERGLGPSALLGRYTRDLVNEIGDPGDPAWRLAPFGKWDEETLAGFLRSRGASAGAVDLLRDTLWFGAGLESGSALSIATGQLTPSSRNSWKAVEGGNDRLPRAMAFELRHRIRYGTEVVAIRDRDAGVEVIADLPRGGPTMRFVADRVISTLPAPVLGRTEIEPELPGDMREAISGLPYLGVLRLFAQMSRQFWRENGVVGPASTDLPIGQIQQHPLSMPGDIEDRAILEGHLRGDQVSPVAALPEIERLELLVQGLEKVHPGAASHFEGGATKAWVDDRWSGGGFSWFGPGQMSRWLPVLARPWGRLHFAGEHTSARNATMEGALESGVRAAREVHEALTDSAAG